MQAPQLLPIMDFSAVDFSSLADSSASPATKKLAAAFADLLGENLETVESPAVVSGGRLPESGNILPVPPASESDAPTDPEQIVESLQRELENLTAEKATLTENLREPASPMTPEISLPTIYPEVEVGEPAVPEQLEPTPLSAPVAASTQLPTLVKQNDSPQIARGPLPEPIAPTVIPTPAEQGKSINLAATPVIAPSLARAELRQALPRETGPVRSPAAHGEPARSTMPDVAIERIPIKVPDSESDGLLRETPLPTKVTAVSQNETAIAPNAAASAARNLAGAVPATPSLASDIATSLAARIDLPVQESGWDRAISERVMMMASNRLQNAEIRLTPADLGPLRVRLAIEDGAANVSFTAQHALTREAIEQALPRLREMLAETGLTLGEASVGDEALDYSTSRDANSDAESGIPAEDDASLASETVSEAPRSVRVADGLVDTFV